MEFFEIVCGTSPPPVVCFQQIKDGEYKGWWQAWKPRIDCCDKTIPKVFAAPNKDDAIRMARQHKEDSQ